MLLKGRVVRVKHAGQDGFAIVVVEDSVGKQWTCCGTLHEAGPDSLVEIEGDLESHPRWGPQVKVRTCRTAPPITKDGAAIYLSEAPGISELVARRIVETLGDDLWPEVKLGGPRVIVIKGVGPERAEKLAKWVCERESIQEAHVQLATWGLNRRACRAVVAAYGPNTLRVIAANPWRLAEEIDGVGFATADDIAVKMGRPFACVERARAGVIHHLNEDERGEGHCYADRRELVQRVSSKLPIPIALVKEALVELASQCVTAEVDGLVYRTNMLMAERAIAEDVVCRVKGVERKASRVVVDESEAEEIRDAVEEDGGEGDTSFDFGLAAEEEPPPIGDAELERFAFGGRR